MAESLYLIRVLPDVFSSLTKSPCLLNLEINLKVWASYKYTVLLKSSDIKILFSSVTTLPNMGLLEPVIRIRIFFQLIQDCVFYLRNKDFPFLFYSSNL